MARRNKKQAIGDDEDVNSSDDSEANADLTLRIAERASISRSEKLRTVETEKPSYSRENTDDKLVHTGGRKPSKKSKKQISVPVLTEDNHQSIVKTLTSPVSEVEDVKPAEPSDNYMLRSLLRGPRYFDAPENGWTICFRCGENGHFAVDCTLVEKKLKPCFMCGSLDHHGKRCPKGIDCFLCKQNGHRARDCPEKWNRLSYDLVICLKCGDSGHDMFSCRNPYPPDDLQQIQCYVCKNFGHLCCVKSVDNTKRIISCYKCGECGHDAPKCNYINDDNTKAYVKKSEKQTKRGKIKPGSKSASAVLEKVNRTKKPKREKEKPNASPEEKEKKKKRRGGWIGEDDEDAGHSRSKKSRYKSPSTPSKRESWMKNGYRYGGSAYQSEKGHSSARKGYYQQNYPESAYNTPTSSYRNGGYSDHSHGHSSVKNGFRKNYNGFGGDFITPFERRDRFEDDSMGSHGNHFRSWSAKNRHYF